MKHLNPRQGITTISARPDFAMYRDASVKHLNPRQGITTPELGCHILLFCKCETPKSPPGDYNGIPPRIGRRPSRAWCETPKSPPGDYNPPFPIIPVIVARICRVKHLNPRQGITTAHRWGAFLFPSLLCVKHLNPRQGITTNS